MDVYRSELIVHFKYIWVIVCRLNLNKMGKGRHNFKLNILLSFFRIFSLLNAALLYKRDACLFISCIFDCSLMNHLPVYCLGPFGPT